MRAFEHIDVFDLRTAIRLLREPQSEALAGGTGLLGELKRRIRTAQRLVNLKMISELKGIGYEKGLRIGSLVTLSEIEQHPVVLKKYPMLAQAISLTATPQLRNMGTIGGNLCQHPRCWYYRSPLFQCWLKGGERCFAFKGENRTHAILGSKYAAQSTPPICHPR
jgi:xanthine dehydrogenase YagS FAD-binding subunit